jgi:hypothetical protein
VGPDYIFLYESNEKWRIEGHVWKVDTKKVDKPWIIPM